VRRLDVRWLHRHGCLAGGYRVLSWSRGERQTGSVGLALQQGAMVVEYRYRPSGREDWEDVRQVIALDWTACHYGGQRPWCHCPGCRGRIAVLCGRGRLFVCRHCAKLPYASQGETALDRLQRKACKMRARFGGQSRKP
jgi:hypothetical protein